VLNIGEVQDALALDGAPVALVLIGMGPDADRHGKPLKSQWQVGLHCGAVSQDWQLDFPALTLRRNLFNVRSEKKSLHTISAGMTARPLYCAKSRIAVCIGMGSRHRSLR
jgi:hypothetical protein